MSAHACSFSHGPASEPAFANGERDAELLCVCGFPKREHALGYSRSRCDFTPVGAAFASIAAQESLVASMAARGARDARVRDAVARIAETRRLLARIDNDPDAGLVCTETGVFFGRELVALLDECLPSLCRDLEAALDEANNAVCGQWLTEDAAAMEAAAPRFRACPACGYAIVGGDAARVAEVFDSHVCNPALYAQPYRLGPADPQPARLAGEP